MDLLTVLAAMDVRSLKGAPLAVMILLLQDPQPHSAGWYENHSGYSNAPITKALRLLVDKNYLVKTSRGWGLSGGDQLKLSTGGDKIVDNFHNNYESTPLVVSSLKHSINNDSDLRTTTSNHKNYETIRALCLDLDIQEPAASQIAKLGVTEDYIRAHVEDVEDLPLAIWRIKNQRKAPKVKGAKKCIDCGIDFKSDSEYQTTCESCLLTDEEEG